MDRERLPRALRLGAPGGVRARSRGPSEPRGPGGGGSAAPEAPEGAAHGGPAEVGADVAGPCSQLIFGLGFGLAVEHTGGGPQPGAKQRGGG